jgi:UDP-N-acetylglucosamine 2-epimerase (non-hydrolysing)
VHLESGLSSGRLSDPFPEEILRRLTFRLTRFALCPNDEAFERMRRLKIPHVVHTGENTILDCVRYAVDSNFAPYQKEPYFVGSIHRFQNIYRKPVLEGIVNEFISMSSQGTVYFILHPPTEKRLKRYGLLELLGRTPRIVLRSRMVYTEFLKLMSGARAVFTDGGSNQEELSYLGVPTVIFRERSERPDGLNKNVILRSGIKTSLVEFAGAGHLDALRREAKLSIPAYPSKAAIESLLKWVK